LVNHITVVVDLLADAVRKIASSKSTNEVAILVTNFTFSVDTKTRHGVDLTFLLFWLPAFCVADDIAVLVGDIAIVINMTSNELLEWVPVKPVPDVPE